jgi:hypothetical protein
VKAFFTRKDKRTARETKSQNSRDRREAKKEKNRRVAKILKDL